MIKELGPGFRLMLIFTILTGLLYPVLMTAFAQIVFPRQANGSLIRIGNKVVGSELIGQAFTKPQYFHPRPSAAGNGYDAAASGGSNLGPTSRKLIDRLKAGAEDFRKQNPRFTGKIPADILTSSSSGLDPHISPAAAVAQVARVADDRGVPENQVAALVRRFAALPDLGFLGEPRVNVLLLNIALDEQFGQAVGAVHDR
jgi:potassium-transporting ATPase KdpC subunit